MKTSSAPGSKPIQLISLSSISAKDYLSKFWSGDEELSGGYSLFLALNFDATVEGLLLIKTESREEKTT
jgi:hypothetical protein